jgi:hypothetical protein
MTTCRHTPDGSRRTVGPRPDHLIWRRCNVRAAAPTHNVAAGASLWFVAARRATATPRAVRCCDEHRSPRAADSSPPPVPPADGGLPRSWPQSPNEATDFAPARRCILVTGMRSSCHVPARYTADPSSNDPGAGGTSGRQRGLSV